ncbi:septum formation initiator family protein [Patescibacteria group bacterium]|nr:septum formation initiator family protein [Patescibacteria group bacterium]
MSTKQNQKRASKIGFIVLANVVILFFLIIGFGREYVSNIQIEREIRERDTERITLLDEQAETLRLIEQLSSEYYLEKEARLKHGLGRDGETVIIVQDGETSGYGLDQLSTDDGDQIEVIENPTKWFYYFFDKSAFSAL